MSDVVVTLPIQTGEESQLFGSFLNRFMESRSWEAAQMDDAPYLMMRSDPGEGQDIKVIIFQENSVASAFSSGWAKARRLGRSLRSA